MKAGTLNERKDESAMTELDQKPSPDSTQERPKPKAEAKREIAAGEDGVPKIAVALGRKINLGNYESADVNIRLSQIPMGATEETIAEMLDTANLAFSMIRQELNKRVKAAKEKTNE